MRLSEDGSVGIEALTARLKDCEKCFSAGTAFINMAICSKAA
jgi:hypothetical protein